MKTVKISKQRGFFGVIIVGLILLGIVVAAISYMSRSSPSGVSDQATAAKSSVMVNQGTDLKNGFDQKLLNGVSASTITFDQSPGTGLFDPTPGGQSVAKPNPPPGLSADPSVPAVFTYSMQVKLPGIGASSSADFVATVGGLSLSACQQTNRNLYSDSASATPATSTGALAAWTTVPAAIDDSAVASANYLGRPEGCVKTSDNQYVYYKALAEN